MPAKEQIPVQILSPEAMRQGHIAGDAAGPHQLGQGLFQGHHAFRLARPDLRAQLMVVAFAYERTYGVGGDHDFGGWPARHAIDSRN